jgi:general stress protein YciG
MSTMDEKQADENVTQGESSQTEQNAEATPTAPTAASPSTEEQPRPRRRGFAAMDRDRVKEIASKGGRAAHAAGTAHQFSSDEARVAGKKGGMAPHVRRGGVRRRPAQETATNTPPVGQSTGDGR